MFIKHGDGKIISVIEGEEELTDEQKKFIKKQSIDLKKNDISEDKSSSKEKN